MWMRECCCVDISNPKHSVYALIHSVYSKYFYCLRRSFSFCQVSPGNWPNSLYSDINLFRQNALEVCNVLSLDSIQRATKELPMVNSLQVNMTSISYWTLAVLRNCAQWSSRPKQNWFSAMLVQMANNFKTTEHYSISKTWILKIEITVLKEKSCLRKRFTHRTDSQSNSSYVLQKF